MFSIQLSIRNFYTFYSTLDFLFRISSTKDYFSFYWVLLLGGQVRKVKMLVVAPRKQVLL